MTETADRDPEWTEPPPFEERTRYDRQTLAIYRETNAIRTLMARLTGNYGEFMARAVSMDENLSGLRKDTGEALYDAGRIYDKFVDLEDLVKRLESSVERNTEAILRNTEMLEKLASQPG